MKLGKTKWLNTFTPDQTLCKHTKNYYQILFFPKLVWGTNELPEYQYCENVEDVGYNLNLP